MERTPSTISQKQILVRYKSTDEPYLPLSFTLVPKREHEILYLPLDFENGLTIDVLVDSGAFVSAVIKSELDRIKQQTAIKIFTIDCPIVKKT